jgi:hypothetical protein
MSPPLDLDSLRRQYPDMPGWGERVFLELYSLRLAVEAKGSWNTKDFVFLASAFAAALVALKGGGVV